MHDQGSPQGATYSQYRSMLRNHFLPALASRPIKAVQPKDLERLYKALEAGGRNPK